MNSQYVNSEMEKYGVCVIKRNGEDPEIMLKRFKKKFAKSGILQECKQRMYYEKPSVRKKRKRREADRRRKKETLKENKMTGRRNK